MLAKIIEILLSLLALLIKPFSPPEEFVVFLDGAISLLIEILRGASWFLPMDIFIVGFSVILLVDNFKVIAKFVKWLIDLIPFI